MKHRKQTKFTQPKPTQNYYYDSQLHKYYPTKDKSKIDQQHHLSLSPMLLSLSRHLDPNITHQFIDHFRFTQFYSNPKMSLGFPIFSFQTPTQMNVLTRNSIELFRFENEEIVPLQKVDFIGEILLFSFGCQMWKFCPKIKRNFGQNWMFGNINENTQNVENIQNRMQNSFQSSYENSFENAFLNSSQNSLQNSFQNSFQNSSQNSLQSSSQNAFSNEFLNFEEYYEFTNDQFCLLLLHNNQTKLINYSNGTQNYEKIMKTKIYSISLCPNDILIGSKNVIRKEKANQTFPVRGIVNCILFPFFSVVSGEIYFIEDVEHFVVRSVKKMSKHILRFVVLKKYLIVQFVNKNLVLVPIIHHNLKNSFENEFLNISQNSFGNSLQNSSQNSLQSSLQNSFEVEEFKEMKESEIESEIELGDEIELHTPITVNQFYCLDNYLLVMNENCYVLCVFDERGILDILCEEHGDFENKYPFILMDEMKQPKIVLIDSNEIKISV